MTEKKNGVTNNFLWKFAERISAQLVTFLVSLVLARILLPEDYGTVSLVLVFIEFANVFVSQGLGSALVQKQNADDLDFSSVLFFNIGFSIVLYFVLFFVSPVIASFYDMEELIVVIRVFSLRLILASINTVQQAYVARKMIFKRFFWSTLLGTLLSGVFGIYLALKGYGVWALVAQYLINTFVSTVVLGITLKWVPKLMYSWKRVGMLFKFGWKILFEGVAETLSGQIRNLIIGKVYSDADLGYYTKAQQFPQLVMTNINASISAVLFPAMSSIQTDRSRLVELMRESVRISSYILFPMLFGISAVATNLVTVLLTEKWLSSVPYIYVACFSYFITIGMYARHEALKSIGRSDVFMVEHMFARVVNFVLLLLVYRISVMAIALSGILGGLILWFTIMYTSKKYTGYQYKDQINDIALLILMSVIMFIPTFLFGYYLNLNPIVELFLQVIIGVTIYLILSIFFKPAGFSAVVRFIKEKIITRGKAIS